MHDVLAPLLRRRAGLEVVDLLAAPANRADLFPTFLQDGADVHGSHPLFYWLRARSRGLLVTAEDAGVVLTWRADVGRLVAVRPVGRLDAVVDLLDRTAHAAATARPDTPLVVRYCTAEVDRLLRERGWTTMSRPWRPGVPADDETFPEVVITAPPVDVPEGQRYKSVRQAIYRHGGRIAYWARPTPARMGEDRFITAGAARAAGPDPHEAAFNRAVISSLGARRHDWLTYHYLAHGSRLAGFAITADITGISHGYFLATHGTPRLATYFLWHIYLHDRRRGAFALNLGGSETADLHAFKTRTFPDHQLRHTAVLQRRQSTHTGR